MGEHGENGVLIFGNGAQMHDRIAGRLGAYTELEAALRAGRPLTIGVVRDNAFALDKIAVYAAGLLGRRIQAPPLSPSPVADLPHRFDFHVRGLEARVEAMGIRLALVDDELPEILKLAAGLAAHEPEADILRLLGIVCRSALVGPHWFVFEVENACNEDCLYCNIHAKGRNPSLAFRKGRMDFQRFAAQVDDLARMGADGVTVLGNGEPTVHPRFLDMILYVKSKGLRVNFFTNGLLLKPELSRKIVEAGCDEMFCTISGGTRESFLALHPMQTPKDYDTLMENLRALFQIRKASGTNLPRSAAVHVICAPNAGELPAMAKQAVELGFDIFRPQLIRVDEHNASLALGDREMAVLRRDLPRAREVCEKAGVEIWGAFEAMVAGAGDSPEDWSGDEFLREGCTIGWTLGLAKCNGDLSLCCVVKPVGNLDEGKIGELWYGQEYHRYRLAALELAENRDLPLRDGKPLYTERCRRCDNHDINRQTMAALRRTGMIRYYRGFVKECRKSPSLDFSRSKT